MDGSFGLVFAETQNEILLVKRRDVPVWVVPGGGIEKNETPEKAVIREVLEESGYKITIKRKISEYFYSKSKKINYIYECEVVSGKARVSSESKEVKFFEVKSLPKTRDPLIDHYLADLRIKSNKIIKKEAPTISKRLIIENFFKHPILVSCYLLKKIGLRINL